jgi:hypothetical protein
MESRSGWVTYWRNLTWQINTLCYCDWALFQWAIQIDVLDLIAKIDGLLDKSDDVIVLDLQVDLGSLGNWFVKRTVGGNDERLAAAKHVSSTS